MTGVVIPDPRGGHVWVYGIDADGNPVRLLVDADGKLQIEITETALPADAATETTLAALPADIAAQTLTVQAAGGDKIFSFESGVYEIKDNTSLAAGVNYLYTIAVPTGKVWVITNVAMCYEGTVPAMIVAEAYHSAVAYTIFHVLSPVSTLYYDRQGWWILEAGDKMRLCVVGATLNDNAYLRIIGFQMDAPS